MPKLVSNLDLNGNQIQNALAHPLASDPGSPSEGQFWYNSTSKTFKFYTGATTIVLGRLDQITAPTGDVSLGSQKITNLATPSASTDAATKGYVDGLTGGNIAWKAPVRAASTGNLNLSSMPAAVDGVTLANAERFLAKDQSTASQNGIYVFNGAAAAATRATDADTGAELLSAATLVQEGTNNADSGWVCTTDATITVGSTALTFVQFTALGQITAGAGLTKTGATLDVVAADGSITVNADSITVGLVTVAKGGTNATDAATARTNLGLAIGTDVRAQGSGDPTRASLGLATSDSPQFAGVNVGAATDTTITRTGAGDIAVEGNAIYRAGGTDVPVTDGGTGASDAATARTNLGAIGRYAADVGDGAATSITVTHSLGTKDVSVTVWDNTTPFGEVIVDVRHTSTSAVTLVFATAPTSAQYRVVVLG